VPAPYPDRQRTAHAKLNDLLANRSTTRVIHYSSESFDDRPTGQSPRVTSIAVRRLDTGQTESFSIHSVAEEQNIPLAAIDANYDALENEMLRRFYAYVEHAGEVSYLHWNMRDANYGFSALEHRYRVLGGTPHAIPESRRFDLARMLQDTYGTEYIGHPRLQRLAEKNGMTMLRFYSGAEEAERFAQKDYIALHQSTLRKVDVLADIAERAHHRTLKTNASWWTQNGGSIRGVMNWIAENKIIALLLTLIGIAIGGIGVAIALAATSPHH
jgi:hypothetical protein